jgi:hypothetical protein
MNNANENHLVITFTDGTYISVVIEYDNNYYLEEYIPALSFYSSNALGYISGGEFHYRKHFKQLIDIGAVKPIDENIIKEKIIENNMKQELREYEQYESLKKKFENYNPKEKYGIEI